MKYLSVRIINGIKVAFILSLYWGATQAVARQDSVAVFQFSAQSMDAVGLENEVAYAVRNELSKRPSLLLMNQREMEVELTRNDIAQTFDTTQALKAAKVLNTNYVIIGTVGRAAGGMTAHIELVSSASNSSVEQWRFAFSNQQAVNNQIGDIGDKLIAAMQQHNQAVASSMSASGSSQWADKIQAVHSEQQVHLSWQASASAPAALGYNLYRSASEQGPFSYIGSVLENQYSDSVGDLSGEVFYQIALLTEEGEELRSEQLARVTVLQSKQSQIVAPVVLKFVPLIRGAEFTVIPSAQNSAQGVRGYHLLRKTKTGPFTIVDTVNLTTEKSNASQSQIQNIQLVDRQSQSINGAVEYAVRAFTANELGQLSESVEYEPATPPQLLAPTTQKIRAVELSWMPVSAGEGYQIFRREPDGSQWTTLVKLTNLSTASYLDTQFDGDGQRFEYAIAVYDKYSLSELSSPLLLASKAPLMAPQSLQASDGLARRVQLNWQLYQDSDLTGFAVYRALFSEGERVKLTRIADVLDPAATQFIDVENLVDGAQYQYAIAAINSAGAAGELTPALTASTKPLPNAPEKVETTVTTEQVTVQWQHGDTQDLKHFIVERRWLDGPWQQLAEVDAQQGQYQDNALMAQARVQYRVLAVDVDGLQSLPRESESVSTINELTLNTPTQNQLRKVTLTWSPILHAQQIKVMRKDETSDWQQVALIPANQTTYLDEKDLFDDVTYTYALQTWYQNQFVTQSNEVTATTKAIPIPEGLTVQSQQPRQIRLSWQAITDESVKGILVFRWLQNETIANARVIAELPVTDAQFVDTTSSQQPIEHGVGYQYALASRNLFDAIGPLSVPVVGASKPLPDAPIGVSAQADDQQITLQWQSPAQSDVVSTEIFKRYPHVGQWQSLGSVNGSATEFIDQALLPNTEVQYRLNFIDSDGLQSAYSTEVTQTSPVKVELVAAENGLLRKASLQWRENPYVDSYQLQRSEDGRSWTQIATTEANQYLDSKDLLDQRRYQYKVIPIHQQTALGSSNPISIDTKDLPMPPANFTASAGEVRQVTLRWQAIDDQDIGGYIIYRQEANGELDKLATLKPDEVMYEDEGGFFSKLDHGTLYSYVISAFNTYKVEGPKSSAVIGETKSLPNAVADVSVVVSDQHVRVMWSANPELDIQSYQLYRSRDCGRSRELTKVNGNETEYLDTQIQAGQQYCYQVTAIDGDGLEGEKSNQATANVPANEESK